MKLDILDVVSTINRKKQVPVSGDMKDIIIGTTSYPVCGIKPFILCLTNDNNKQCIISGETTLEVVIPCDRCLEDVTEHIQVSINRQIPIEQGHLVLDEDEDVTFLEESELDVDRLIYDEILVNWPTKVLCKDDCKGLCPVCGQNLNRQDCGCDRQVLDPRMAKFQDIFNEFKEV
jgi:uncharacterized protein